MRALLGLLLAALTAGMLSSCGSSATSGGGGGLGTADIAQAAAATRSAKTARVFVHVSTKSDALAQPIVVDGNGEADLASHRFHFTASLSGAPTSGAPGGLKIEEILTGSTIYMRSPALAQVSGSDKWLKLDLNQLGSKLGINFSQLLNSGTSDPTQGLELLRAESGSVTKVGSENVRGTPTTHYRATIDLTKYPDVVPADRREAAKATVAQITKLTGTTKFPEDVWIDAQHRVRRFALTEDVTPPTGGKAHVETTGELYDFGAPVDISAPPASDTQDASKLLSGGLGSGG